MATLNTTMLEAKNLKSLKRVIELSETTREAGRMQNTWKVFPRATDCFVRRHMALGYWDRRIAILKRVGIWLRQ